MAIGRKSGTVPTVFNVKGSAAVPAYYGFFDPGDSTIIASVYDSLGGYVADLGAAAAIPSVFPYSPAFIRTDSFGATGDGSLAWMNADGTISVFDPVAAAVSTFAAATSGYLFGGIWFAAGWLYWCELGAAGLAYHVSHQVIEIRLRKIRADGSGAATVSTTTKDSTSDFTPEFGKWNTFVAARMSATGVYMSADWDDKNPDGTGKLACVIGGALDYNWGGGDLAAGEYGISGIPAGAVSLCLDPSTGAPCTATDAFPATVAPAWPSVSFSPANLDATATEAMAYHPGGGVARGSFATFGGTPSTVIAGADIADHPTLAAKPNFLFIQP